jgi:hypothetical protein
MDWRGPYQVIQRHKGEYELRDPALNDPLFMSEHLLEPYHVDYDHSKPIEVAVQDRSMVITESVLDVEGCSYARSCLKLLIKWADEAEPQWRLWNKTFLQNRLCHEFFWQKGRRHWRTLMPTKFKQQFLAAEAQPVRVGAEPHRLRPREPNPNQQPRHHRRRSREQPKEPDPLQQAATTRLGRVVRRPVQADM